MIETKSNLHRSWYDYSWDWALISLFALVLLTGIVLWTYKDHPQTAASTTLLQDRAPDRASRLSQTDLLRMFSRQEFRSCVPLSYKSIRPHNAHAEYLSFSAMVIPFESVRALCYPTC
jgi:hypothetical protein